MMGVCRRFRWLLRAFRVEPAPFETLLRAKLVLDHRKTAAQTGGTGMMQNAGLQLTLVIYALMGIVAGLMGMMVDDPFAFGLIAYSMGMMFIAMPILVDFSHILLDTTDLDVMLPLPVSDRVVLAVRLVHVSLYLALMTLCLGVPMAILGSFNHSPVFFPVHLVAMALGSILVLGFVTLLYVTLLKRVNVEKFRDAMLYVQVFVLMFGFGGWQVVSRYMPQLDESLGTAAWVPYLPPAWLAGFTDFVLGDVSALNGLLAALAVAVPIGVFGALAAVARRGVLARLASSNTGGEALRSRAPWRGFAARLGPRLTAPGADRAGYHFVTINASADRNFKMRTWPAAGLMVVAFVPFLFSVEDVASLARWLVFFPYVMAFFFLSNMDTGRFTETPDARWLLDEMSPEQKRLFRNGANKAFIARSILVPVLLFAVPVILVAGYEHAFDYVFASELALLFALMVAPKFGRDLPFTMKFTTSASQTLFALFFGASVILALLIGVHLLVNIAPFGAVGGAVVAGGLLMQQWHDRVRAAT